MTKGNLYLIPCTLGDTPPLEVLPFLVKKAVEEINYFVVEHEKSARPYREHPESSPPPHRTKSEEQAAKVRPLNKANSAD